MALGYPPPRLGGSPIWQLLSPILHRRVHLSGRIGTSAALPWKSPAGSRDGGSAHGKTCNVLSLIRLLGWLLWSQVPAATGNASAVEREPGCPANNAEHESAGRGNSQRGSGHRGKRVEEGQSRGLWKEEVLVAHPWSYVPPVSPSAALSRLCPRLSPAPRSPSGMFPPGSGSWLGKAVIYLQTCLVASPGRGRAQGGDAVGWRLAGLLEGQGVRQSRALGSSCPESPSGLCQPLSPIWDNTETLSVTSGLAVGKAWDSSEVRAHCSTLCAPVLTAATAGGNWSSAPSGISLHQLLRQGLLARRGDTRQLSPL